jgi:hypothetical protein
VPHADARVPAGEERISSSEPERPIRGDPGAPPTGRRADDLFFSFATIADSHLLNYRRDDYRYLKCLTISSDLLSRYVRDINDRSPPVSFVVHLGDVTDKGMRGDFARARTILDELRCPWHAVIGNHDNFKSDGKQGFKEFSGRDSTTYSFDHGGYHFVIIDCTPDPYVPENVGCDSMVRDWVEADLATAWPRPAVIFSHYNMWERTWDAFFDTTQSYEEYRGMPELRRVLERAGNVVAVINGHVHANRVEVHNGIYYIDVGATLVGRPSIRYFDARPGRIEVDYEYISDADLLEHAEAACLRCCCCFDAHLVCDFIDGEEEDKRFTVGQKPAAAVGTHVREPSFPLAFNLIHLGGRRYVAGASSGLTGALDLALYDVRGRLIDRCRARKEGSVISIDLVERLPAIKDLPGGVYFLRLELRGHSRTRKLVLLQS